MATSGPPVTWPCLSIVGPVVGAPSNSAGPSGVALPSTPLNAAFSAGAYLRRRGASTGPDQEKSVAAAPLLYGRSSFGP